MDWSEFARACATDAHENWFEARFGAWYIQDRDVAAVLRNNPYAQYPEARDELAEFRRELTAKGTKELAIGTYPEDGYTYAMVIDAVPIRLSGCAA